MTFDEILAQVLELLQHLGRVSYRTLKRRFGLDDEYLEDLKAEIIQAQKLAMDEDGEVLVWVGETAQAGSQKPGTKAKPAKRKAKAQKQGRAWNLISRTTLALASLKRLAALPADPPRQNTPSPLHFPPLWLSLCPRLDYGQNTF